MINSDFMIKYTNGLYSTPADMAPRYDEFRDMFSSGQLMSKEWLVHELQELQISGDITPDMRRYVIAGSWFGTLGQMIMDQIFGSQVTFLDIDPRCEKFLHNIHRDDPSVKIVTGDMYEYLYNEDIIINTSCEHIPDLKAWLDLIPNGSVVVLQSNNYRIPEHISCIDSIDELVDNAKLSVVKYKGALETPVYTRFMVIGTK